MYKLGTIVGLVSIILVTIFGISRCDKKRGISEDIMFAQIKTVEDLKNLFPKTSEEIQKRVKNAIVATKQKIEELIAIPADQRTFENTAYALDRLTVDSDLEPVAAACAVLKEVSTDEVIRNSCRDALQAISEFEIDWISGNVRLYKAFKSYVENQSEHEDLRSDQSYFLQETMKSFRRSGLDLPAEQLENVKKIQKELVDLSLAFSGNISSDTSAIDVKRSELKGLEDEFIGALQKNEAGEIIIPANMPNYKMVMENCSVAGTRKKMYRTYRNRAYPVNVKILEKIISKRDELAKLLGFTSYAHLNLDSQMVKTPDRVQIFLRDLLKKLNKKEQLEFDVLSKELPESIAFTKNGKLNPWDVGFVHNSYKKEHLAVDEQKLSEYFQLENTLSAMFDLYETFFGVRFEPVQAGGFWHSEVKLVKVFNAKTDKLISYLLLDLHPRPHKYSHAAHFGMISGIKDSDLPAVGFVVANFPKSTANKPSLLLRSQVNTLFHEFGHAMHHILGRTHLESQAGTATTTDFVEVPSQMLEDWLWDADVLSKISKHYKTGKSIPREQIEKILALKTFDSGWFWQRQTFFALLSLSYFDAGRDKDIKKIFLDLERDIVRNVASDETTHFYASFGHLTGYGARYYGYIWSKVLSVDIFQTLNKSGILQSDAGKKYVETIVGQGGSKDPNEMIRDFLGREPNDVSFCKDMGLDGFL